MDNLDTKKAFECSKAFQIFLFYQDQTHEKASFKILEERRFLIKMKNR